MDFTARSGHLLDYWTIIARRRWIVYLALSAVTLTALVGSFLTTPLYRSTAVLQIERQNPDILTFRDLAQVDYSFAAYSDFYETQYKVLSSLPVARKAARRLSLAEHPFFAPADSQPGLLARLKSILPRGGKVRARDHEEIVAEQLLAGLEIAPVRNSHLVQVSWVSSDPDLSAQVANAMADAFIQFNIESQYSTSDQAEEFLINQIGMLKREIGVHEDRLQEYGEAKRIVSIDDSNNVTLQALKAISERRTAAQTTLAKAQADHEATLAAPTDALAEVLNSDLIARLRQEYAAYEAELTEKSRQFKDGWPGMQTLESKFEQAKLRLDVETERIAAQVRAAAEADYRKALGEVANLDRLLTAQEQAAQRLKRDAVEYATLQTEVRKKRETLNALIARQNEMALSTRLQDMDSTSTNIRVMEQARPAAAPFSPNTKLNLILGLGFGLVLGVGMALFLEYLDNTISSAAELQSLTGLPTLAVIPRYREGGVKASRMRRRQAPSPAGTIDFVTRREAGAAASEAFRELRTAILLSNPGSPPRRIAITSSVPEEGKTATAINLAVVLAQLGRRVLLVDTDLRRPRLHKAFDVRNERGVSNYLSGNEADPTKLVLETALEHLDLLPSGPIPPNPSELLNSTTFLEMGSSLIARGYDHIVFDSPPSLSVADPVIIANVVDVTILVARSGFTPKQSVREVAAKLRQSNVAHVGAVLNDFDAESQGGSYYGYHAYRARETEADSGETQPRAEGAGS